MGIFTTFIDICIWAVLTMLYIILLYQKNSCLKRDNLDLRLQLTNAQIYTASLEDIINKAKLPGVPPPPDGDEDGIQDKGL